MLSRQVNLCNPFDPSCWNAFVKARKDAELEFLNEVHIKNIICLVTLESLLEQDQMKTEAQNQYALQTYKKYTDSWFQDKNLLDDVIYNGSCLLYTSPSPRDRQKSRMPSSA